MPEILYGNKRIHFELTFSARKTLEISVMPDGKVSVKAPQGKDVEAVRQRVQKRARWILKQQAYFRQFMETQPPKEYVSGESFRYLGKQYRLKVLALEPVGASHTDTGETQKNGEATKETAKLIGGYLRVWTRCKQERDHVKKLVDKWYRQHAQRKFAERVKLCYEIMRKHGIQHPTIEIRRMKNRWGSCTPQKRILLNPRLIEFPTYCIDYVILHEMCHLLHPYHSKEFYRLLKSVLPEWEAIKNRLSALPS